MKFYILASLIIFILVINHSLRRNRSLQEKQELNFWERERLANEVRRKSLDGLDYIKIPLDRLPMDACPGNEEIAECQRLVSELSAKPIVNLTGFTNTDLKFEYGTANITVLSEYDENYTLLASTLERFAELLLKAGEKEAAREVLEFAVSTRTDVCKTYDLLSDLYLEAGETAKIDTLVTTAEHLNSLNRDVILRHLSQKSG